LTEAAVVEDASFVWWAIRPSLSQPTLELRIADVCTRIEDALCLAALYRCLIRHLTHDPGLNANIDVIDRAIAQRAARNAGRSRTHALREVIDWLRRTTAES
jgi:carboxylate-amine ligase